MPTAAEGALIALMVDHAVALVQQARRADAQFDADGQLALRVRLDSSRRIAAAVGLVMSLHHLDRVQAAELLVRIGRRTHQDPAAVADSVVHTGSLPAADVRCPAEPVALVPPLRSDGDLSCW
ncbi:MAG TPA: ANTAR domain-containing protein [Nakamurella sp.]